MATITTAAYQGINMNSEIKKLKIELLRAETNVVEIGYLLQKAYNKVFDTRPELENATTAISFSNNYTQDEFGEINSWVRFDMSDFEDCKDYLVDYMQSVHNLVLDFKNETLSISHGPSIIINEDGHVYDQDSGKCILERSDYSCDGEVDIGNRNKLIEAYMQKTGYFTGVFIVDAHSNVFSVDTHKTQK